MRHLMRSAIRTLEGYKAPYLIEGIKLDANENTYPLKEALKVHMEEWVRDMPLNYYPDTNSQRLRNAIAKAYEVDAANVICGVGSDQLIDCLLRTFIEKGDVVVATKPSFSMYKLSTLLNEGTFKEVPLTEAFDYNHVAFCEAIERYQPKMIFLCNPNNPTGTLIPSYCIEEVVKKAKGIVVIDEAYAEFHEEIGLGFMRKYPHVIVLRTFSKAYGLAGARIGYGIASQELIACMEVVRPPYNINAFSQEVACFVMENQEAFQGTIGAIKHTRDQVRETLLSLGIEVAPSVTNFLWMQTTLPLEEVLQQTKVYIKRFIYEGTTYYRMSIGTPEEMTYVVEQIAMLQGKEKGASR